MSKHRFIGDLAGNRDHRGHWIGPGEAPSIEPVGAPALCDVCGATPEDPECLCKPDETGTESGTGEVSETSETSETVASETGTESGTEAPETVETDSEK
jgi:hypothetical protein